MSREFAGKTVFGRDESDDRMHTVDVALFPRFNLCVNHIDNTAFFIFSPRKLPQNTKTIDDSTRREFYSAAIMPFLQSSYDIFALDGGEAGSGVDVDVGVFYGGVAEFADGEGGG